MVESERTDLSEAYGMDRNGTMWGPGLNQVQLLSHGQPSPTVRMYWKGRAAVGSAFTFRLVIHHSCQKQPALLNSPPTLLNRPKTRNLTYPRTLRSIRQWDPPLASHCFLLTVHPI